jgi:NarL family two-component system response regulator LiaR
MSERVRVLIVEDDGLLRRTLEQLLEMDRDLHVVGSEPNGELAVRAVPEVRPQVVLMDIAMPRMDGIEATKVLAREHPDVDVVILTKFDDDEAVFAALKAGARGYVLKDAGLDEVRRAILEAASGEAYLSPAMVQRVLGEFRRASSYAKESRAVFGELSRREMEVLELLAQGLRNRQIAERLFLSEKTVKTHIGAILRKLHLNDRTEAALLAQKHGLSD